MARECYIVGVVGKQGGGKTFRQKQECEYYAKNDIQKGKKARKVLIFDCNPRSGSYAGIKTINFDIDKVTGVKKFKTQAELKAAQLDCCKDIIQWNTPEIRRVVNYRKDGTPMTIKEMNETCLLLMEYFTDGMLVMEDTNAYLIGSALHRFISTFVRCRHRNVELFLIVQSMRALDPRMLGNISMYRMHKTIDSIDTIKNKIPETFEMLKIAELIVNNQFDKGNKYYCMYANTRDMKLHNCPISLFTEACKQYLRMYNGDLKRFAAERDIPMTNAADAWIKDRAKQYLGSA